MAAATGRDMEPGRAEWTQDVVTVARAEIARHMRPGGTRGALLAAAAVGVGVGVLMLILDSRLTDDDGDHFTVLSVELGAALCAFIIGVGVVFSVGRDNRGQLRWALGLVPNRRRLYLARAAGFVTISAAAPTAVALILCGVSVLTHGVTATGWALLAVVLAFFGSGLLGLFAFALTTLVRNSSAGILLFIGVLVVLPIAFFAAGMYLPQQWQEVSEVFATNTPLLHLLEGLSASNFQNSEQSGWSVLRGILGVAAWALVLTLLAWPVFKNQEV